MLSEQKRYTVTRGTVEDRFQLVAEVAPLRWEPLAFAVDGKLGAVLVSEGEEAEEGQILAELIMPGLLEQLEQARLDLSKNESVLWVYENEQSFNLEERNWRRAASNSCWSRPATPATPTRSPSRRLHSN